MNPLIWATGLILLSSPAHAYIGLGPGLGMLGSLLTLIGGVFLALLMVLIYPIRMMLRRMKTRKSAPENAGE